LILVRTAIDLASPDGRLVPLMVAAAVAVTLGVAARARSTVPLALALVVGAGIWTMVATGNVPVTGMTLWTPQLNSGAFDLSTIGSALVLLVIPQLPLTLGNAVVAVVDLEHRYFPEDAGKVTSAAVSYSTGVANVAVGVLGGMPMCHGSGGLTAHYRAGARTYRMNATIGGALLIMGLLFGSAALAIIGLVPAAVLGGFLAFTGFFHASLAAELKGSDLAIAVTMGLIGLLTTNLALALGVGLMAYWPLALGVRRRGIQPVRS
jgi:hypothetical protein